MLGGGGGESWSICWQDGGILTYKFKGPVQDPTATLCYLNGGSTYRPQQAQSRAALCTIVVRCSLKTAQESSIPLLKLLGRRGRTEYLRGEKERVETRASFSCDQEYRLTSSDSERKTRQSPSRPWMSRPETTAGKIRQGVLGRPNSPWKPGLRWSGATPTRWDDRGLGSAISQLHGL